MNTVLNVVLFIIGLTALFVGGEVLVKGSARLSSALGVRPLVIGLTVVAFGTSSPEFLVSLVAVFKGSNDIVLGNIIGSNIANIGLVLGIASIICPLKVHMKLLKLEIPVMIILSIVLYAMSWYLKLGHIEGLILFGSLIVFLVYIYFQAKQEPREVDEEYREFIGNKNSIPKHILFVIVGLTLLLVGAKLVVDSAILIARTIGISELVIGLTAVAIGTSLPELATSVMAAIRRQHGLLLGNIVGSNIFNIGILGLISSIKPISVKPDLLRFELPVMIIFTLAVFPIMKTDYNIKRFEGILLVVFYVIFVLILFFRKEFFYLLYEII